MYVLPDILPLLCVSCRFGATDMYSLSVTVISLHCILFYNGHRAVRWYLRVVDVFDLVSSQF